MIRKRETGILVPLKSLCLAREDEIVCGEIYGHRATGFQSTKCRMEEDHFYRYNKQDIRHAGEGPLTLPCFEK
jgi:hypothetical protein